MDYELLEKHVNKIKQINGREKQKEALYFIVRKYINLEDARMVAELALNFPHLIDINVAEQFILSQRDAQASCRFARFIKTSKLKQHEEIVLEAGNPTLSRLFCTIKGADLAKHSQIILKGQNARESCEFVTAHPKIDKKAHLAVILQDNNPNYLLQTAIKLKGAGCKAIENALLKFNNPEYSYIYATKVPDADIDSHQGMVLFTGTLDDVLKFAQDVEETNIRFLINRLWERWERKPTKELKETMLKLLDLYDEREAQKNQEEKQ